MAEKSVQRRRATIVIADVVGYNQLMEVEEENTRTRLRFLLAN
jgi:class 3 adenylate cyclase